MADVTGSTAAIKVARGRVIAWLRNRRGHSGRGVTPPTRRLARDQSGSRGVAATLRRNRRRDGRIAVWRPDYITAEDLLYFRGDNCYVWQFQDGNAPEKYVLTYLYLKSIDRLGLLDVLTESGDYGVFTFPTGEADQRGGPKLVSRDLLDSVCELLFLDRTLQISRWPGLRVLDIGAGYGRLAYRAVTAFNTIDTYFCVDAVPESTFLSEYDLDGRPRQHACHRVRRSGGSDPGTIHLVVDIHSFSECAIEAVNYWVSRCAELKIEYLLIVPNASAQEGKALRLIEAPTSVRLLARHGYRAVAFRAAVRHPEVQRYGVSPKWYYLFGAA